MLMKMEFTLNALNNEVLGICDLTPHAEFGGKDQIQHELSWPLGNFVRPVGTPDWAANCSHSESIMTVRMFHVPSRASALFE